MSQCPPLTYAEQMHALGYGSICSILKGAFAKSGYVYRVPGSLKHLVYRAAFSTSQFAHVHSHQHIRLSGAKFDLWTLKFNCQGSDTATLKLEYDPVCP